MAVAATTLEALRRRLDEVVRGDAPERPGLPTGLASLDRRLAGGGLPRGRVTELVGSLGAGRTTLARELVRAALAQGVWVAYVDATRTLAPRDWAGLEGEAAHGAAGGGGGSGGGGGGAVAAGRLWVVRPPEAARAAWCADVLLRSGAFGLVVLDGLPSPPRRIAVRLARLAQESDAALVVLADGRDAFGRRGPGGPGGPGGERGERGARAGRDAAMLGGAVRLRVERSRPERRGDGRGGEGGAPGARFAAARRSDADVRRRGLRITVEKGGSRQPVEVACAVVMARRLCAHPEVPDRRGVAPDGRRGGADGRARPAERGAAGAAGAGRQPQRQQRPQQRSSQQRRR